MTEKLDFKGLDDIAVALKKQGKKRADAMELLEELELIEGRMNVDSARSKEIKLELERIQTECKQKGLRYGNLCYIARLMDGKKTLDKVLLLENGVKATVIEASMKLGDPYIERRFKNLKKDNGNDE